MTTENETIEPVVDEKKEPEAQPQLTEIEQRALEMGWRPKDQFNGDEDDFIDAKEFVRRQPLFDKIDSQGKQLKLVNRALNALKEHYTKVNEAAYNRAIHDLKAQRKQAITDGDGDAFAHIDEQIKEAEQARQQLDALNEALVESAEPNPEFVAWTNRNTWYSSVKYMRTFADELGVSLHRQGLPPNVVLQRVEEAVRKEFPEKFRNPNKASAVQVENGRSPSTKAKDSFELTDFERKVMNDFVRTGVMTKEEYIKSLKETKGRA